MNKKLLEKYLNKITIESTKMFSKLLEKHKSIQPQKINCYNRYLVL